MKKSYQLATTVKVCYCYCFYFDQLISGNRLAPPIELFATDDFFSNATSRSKLVVLRFIEPSSKTIIHKEMTEKVWPYPSIKIVR